MRFQSCYACTYRVNAKRYMLCGCYRSDLGSVLPAISKLSLSETEKIVLNIQNFSIYAGTTALDATCGRGQSNRWANCTPECQPYSCVMRCSKEDTKLVADKGKLVEVVERSGVVPNGTGFTITTGAAPALNRTHLIVGQVIEGMDVVEQLEKLPVVKNNSSSPFFIVGKAAGDKRANVAELGFDRPFKKVAVANAGIIE